MPDFFRGQPRRRIVQLLIQSRMNRAQFLNRNVFLQGLKRFLQLGALFGR